MRDHFEVRRSPFETCRMARVFIGVGSNEGDRLALISKASRAIGSLPNVQLRQTASILETEPVGGPPQGPYLNTVVELETTLSPEKLLGALQEIERQLGRVSSAQRWAPRPIDLDLLLYNDHIIGEPHLTIPHPRLHDRLFVLEPLAQLAPDVLHPVFKRTIGELLSAALSSLSLR